MIAVFPSPRTSFSWLRFSKNNRGLQTRVLVTVPGNESTLMIRSFAQNPVYGVMTGVDSPRKGIGTSRVHSSLTLVSLDTFA